MGLWLRYVEWCRRRALARKPAKPYFYFAPLVLNILSVLFCLLVAVIGRNEHSEMNLDGVWSQLIVFWMLLLVVWLLFIPLYMTDYRLRFDKELCVSAEYSSICLRNAILLAFAFAFLLTALLAFFPVALFEAVLNF